MSKIKVIIIILAVLIIGIGISFTIWQQKELREKDEIIEELNTRIERLVYKFCVLDEKEYWENNDVNNIDDSCIDYWLLKYHAPSK